jgi:predicted transcriptional regulator
MTEYLCNINRILDTFEAIIKHDGKNLADIVKDEGWQPLRYHIDELIDNGLAKKYRYGYREVHLTRKGYEVYELLRQAKERMDDDDGADEYHIFVDAGKRGYER